MKIALIGLPQTGKKSIYSLLTGNKVDSPLKKPALGIVQIKDQRIQILSDMYKPQKTIAAAVDVILVPDIDKQQEKNRELFQNLQNADVICYTARSFTDESVFHIDGDIDPKRDINTILSEFIISDLIMAEKRIERLEKELRAKKETSKEEEKELMIKIKTHLDEEKPLSEFQFSETAEKIISGYNFITRKPIIIILNVDEEQISEQVQLNSLAEQFKHYNIKWVQVSAKIEKEIQNLESEEEKSVFMQDMGIEKSALEKVTMIFYQALGLITFFTVGTDEVRGWMVKKDSFAPQAARVIHTDLEKGFIRAEIMKYKELIEAGTESALKAAGKTYVKGKDYIVEDGDIMNVLFNVKK